MAAIRPFTGIHFAKNQHPDVSRVIAPPYDVLDERQKAALEASDPYNIVRIDLPHMPPKSVGPDAAYQQAADTLQDWLKRGVLKRDARPAFYPYAQGYEHGGRMFHRRGFIALVRLSPFGAGEIVPHEKTYKGPIEDRLKLMRATGVQLSPIFGLFSDPRGEINNLLFKHVGRPELSGMMGDVRNDLWSISEAEVETQLIDLMKARPIYIADGHHRYTTALQYKAECEQASGGKPLPADHPANWCMFVLVAMQDPGLLILPTHRLIGGLEGFDLQALKAAMGSQVEVVESPLNASAIAEFINQALPKAPPNTIGLFDGRTRKLYELHIKNNDLLKPLEPDRSDAWRRLDVAILQRYLLDEVIQPTFAPGREPARGYTADPDAIAPQVDGTTWQIALLLKPTPLHALEELGRHNEVMPQKSTYFYPKLATGMVINPLK